MNLEVNGHNIFLILFICFFASTIFVFITKKVAEYMHVYDEPDGIRKIHKKPIPLLGGIGIFLSFLLGYMLFAPKNTLMLSILIASFLILILGIFDDIKPIKARYKILIHIIVAMIVVLYGGLKIDSLTVFDLFLNFGDSVLSNIVSILIVVGTINAINLIDGMDGLCAGVSSIYFLTVSILAIILNKFAGLDIILSIIMLGSTLGFLVYNFPPAKIFMGDTGSTFLGLMISVIMLIGFKTVTFTSLLVPLLILALPVLDTLFAIIRRVVNKKNIGEADKEHIHHQLLKRNSSKKSLIIIYTINILFSITTILYTLGNKREILVCYVILLFGLIYLILKTDIIFHRNDKKKGKK